MLPSDRGPGRCPVPAPPVPPYGGLPIETRTRRDLSHLTKFSSKPHPLPTLPSDCPPRKQTLQKGCGYFLIQFLSSHSLEIQSFVRSPPPKQPPLRSLTASVVFKSSGRSSGLVFLDLLAALTGPSLPPVTFLTWCLGNTFLRFATLVWPAPSWGC